MWKKWNDNFLACLEMFLLFWYAFLNPLFFSNHYFSFPTLKITTEAVSPFGNTFCLFKEWKGLDKITKNLTAHNWQKWKRVFLTCPCHNIYRDEAAGLKSCKCTWKLRFLWICGIWGNFVKNWYFVNNCLI